MRKSLILLVIILLLTAVGFIMFNSINIGGLHILGLSELSDENKKLDTSIQNLSRLSSTGYQEALKKLGDSAKQYTTAKQEYDEIASVSTGSEFAATQIQKYEIEYLWTRIGTHASNENVKIKMDIEANATSNLTGYYDLKFNVTGSYVDITDFIYDIENDSSLGFKVENFKMAASSASFTCSNVAINIDESLLTKNQKTEGESEEENSESSDSNANDNTTNTSNDNTTNTNALNTNSTSVNTASNTNTSR